MQSSNRHTWIIGNWKKNPASLTEVTELMSNIKSQMAEKNLSHHIQNRQTDTAHLMVVPTTLHIVTAKNAIDTAPILVGCQDISSKTSTVGAYTGDCSAQQMKEAGVSWTLIGHSERRHYHKEDNEVLLTKVQHAYEQNLGVVFCIGETLEERENDNTMAVLTNQLIVIKNFIEAELSKPETNPTELAANLIIAYEPVWAIGTGKVPTTSEVEAVNQNIRHYLTSIHDSLNHTPVLYGGSVNAGNAEQFAQSEWIDGALIGGASLVADSFLSIAETFFTIKSKQSS